MAKQSNGAGASVKAVYRAAHEAAYSSHGISEMVLEKQTIAYGDELTLAEVYGDLVEACNLLSREVSADKLLKFREANPYPAQYCEWCEASYLEIAYKIGIFTLEAIEDAVDPEGVASRLVDASKRLRSMVAGEKQPSPTYPTISQSRFEACFTDLTRELQRVAHRQVQGSNFGVHLWKEAIRVTGDQRLSPGVSLTELDEDICRVLQSGPAGNSKEVLYRLDVAGCVHVSETVRKALAKLKSAGVLVANHPNGKYGYKLVQN
ncbi:hypothetical protein [Botrimarina mediterranea]|uniref:hypothetical protein n=1 Tax=Botrimarina mediterranea TaxID=2528022 RepID=UPI001188FF19|nr:hypothetical protein K2D_06040 [Planctomycetes bacterium K2D]